VCWERTICCGSVAWGSCYATAAELQSRALHFCAWPCLQVGLSRKQIARLIGRVFIQKSAVNLLSTVGRCRCRSFTRLGGWASERVG